MVSQDGGVPLRSKSWEGHASDTQIFQERAPALLATFRGSPTPRSLVAAATLSHEEHAPHLAQRGCITRIPGTLTLVTPVITQALRGDTWQSLDAMTRSQRMALCHDGMAQRWLVVWSQAALERAEARGNTACPREAETLHNPLFPLQAQRCEPPPQAQEVLAGWAKTWRDHPGDSSELRDHKRSDQKGRPPAETPIRAIAWQRHAQGKLEAERLQDAKQHQLIIP
jgi:hypothetical protein